VAWIFGDGKKYTKACFQERCCTALYQRGCLAWLKLAFEAAEIEEKLDMAWILAWAEVHVWRGGSTYVLPLLAFREAGRLASVLTHIARA